MAESGVAEQETLHNIGARRRGDIELGLRLDPLDDHRHSRRMGNRDHRADEAAPRASPSTSSRKLRSSLTTSTGSRRRYDSDE